MTYQVVISVFKESWLVLGEMAPYLIFGFFVAGLLSLIISQETVEKHLGGKGVWPVIKATLLGIPLPLCSCGVLPVAASLRRHGASRGATTSFLISTPQTGIDSIMITFALLGPIFAVFRPLSALISGILGGLLILLFASKNNGPELGEETEKCCSSCCSSKGKNKIINAAHYAFVTLPADIAKALLFGILLVGLVATFIPDHFFAGLIGSGILSLLIMMAVSMPVYVCATASVPIAAALIAKGVTPGAALVFLIAGPATNLAALSTIWQILGKKAASLYLITVAISAIISGLILNAIFAETAAKALEVHQAMFSPQLKNISAIILSAILFYSLINKHWLKKEEK